MVKSASFFLPLVNFCEHASPSPPLPHFNFNPTTAAYRASNCPPSSMAEATTEAAAAATLLSGLLLALPFSSSSFLPSSPPRTLRSCARSLMPRSCNDAYTAPGPSLMVLRTSPSPGRCNLVLCFYNCRILIPTWYCANCAGLAQHYLFKYFFNIIQG